MKIRLLVVLSALGLLGSSPVAPAQETNTAANELKALVSKIQDKLHEGKKTEADLGPELKEFDTLIEKHKAEKTDDTAQIVLMKAMLYLEVFDDSKKGTALVEDLKRDYPDTKAGKNADGILANIKQEEAAKEIQRTLVAGAKFPDFAEKDLEGKPLSPSNFKGKVVLIDFWATWCRPCVMELPNVQKA